MDVETSFRETLIREELYCPKCEDPLFPPIYHCDKGHSYCHSCYEYGSDCKLCGAKCSGGRTHHLDRIVQLFTYPCKFSNKGCKKICIIEKLRVHQQECQTYELTCPFSFGLGCPNTGNKLQTVFHCQLAHNNRSFVGDGIWKFRLTQLFSDLIEINETGQKKSIFVDFFMLYVDENIFQVVYQTDLENLKVAMYRVSLPSEANEKYQFRMYFYDSDNTQLAMISSECVTTVGKVYSPISDAIYVRVDEEILKACQTCSLRIVPKN